MNYLNKIRLSLVANVVLFLFTLFSAEIESAICSEYWRCGMYFDDLDYHIFLVALIMLLSIVVLSFLSESTFGVWFKFSVVFLPLSILLIIFSSPMRGGFTGVLPSDRELALLGLGIIYFIISLAIIIYQMVKDKKTNSNS